MGSLAKGTISGEIGENTINFVEKSNIPSNIKVTYLQIVADIRLQKEVQKKVWLTVGGDKVVYLEEVNTRTVDIEMFNFLK